MVLVMTIKCWKVCDEEKEHDCAVAPPLISLPPLSYHYHPSHITTPIHIILLTDDEEKEHDHAVTGHLFYDMYKAIYLS